MKVNSVSGLVLFVKDLDVTAKFYDLLGFRFGKREGGRLTLYVNWFWIDFIKVSDQKVISNNSELIHVNVTDVDETYKFLKTNKLDPSEPVNNRFGRRETMIHDPDGYKLVFFTKK